MTTTENAVLLGYNLKMLFSGRNSPLVVEDKNLLGGVYWGNFSRWLQWAKFWLMGGLGKPYVSKCINAGVTKKEHVENPRVN